MIFFGTSQFSVHILNKLAELGVTPAHIVTVPDRPQGRKMLMTPPPVKVWAEARGIPVFQFEKLRPYTLDGHEVNPAQVLKGFNPETFLVASYGKIIPQAVLDVPTHGAFNIHPSLLPKYRGASPLQSTLLANEQELGVCIIKMDAEMDHGPIAAIEYLTPGKSKLPMWPLRFSEYEKITAQIGAELFAQILPSILAGTHEFTLQNHEAATFTKKIAKEDGHVAELSDTLKSASSKESVLSVLHNPQNLSTFQGEAGLLTYARFCALEEWPGLYFFIKKAGTDFRVKITNMVWHKDVSFAEITHVTPEGKKEMHWKEFLNFIETTF